MLQACPEASPMWSAAWPRRHRTPVNSSSPRATELCSLDITKPGHLLSGNLPSAAERCPPWPKSLRRSRNQYGVEAPCSAPEISDVALAAEARCRTHRYRHRQGDPDPALL